MAYSAVILMSFIIILLFFLGVLIKYYKCYWLISGYNTASEERKKNMDIEGLGRFMGDFCFLLAGILLLGTVLNYLGFFYGFVIALGSLFIIIPVMLIKAQRFDYNTQTPEGKTKKSVILIICLVMLVIFLIPAGTIYYGAKEPQITIGTDQLVIDAVYGTTVPLQQISEVSLLDDLPSVAQKVNGFDFGHILKGDFELDELGRVKLFLDRRNPPFILIQSDKTVIFNFKEEEKTRELYHTLKAKIE